MAQWIHDEWGARDFSALTTDLIWGAENTQM